MISLGILDEIKARSLSGELSSLDKKFIQQNYELVTFKEFKGTNCGRCYEDAFIEMYVIFQKYGVRDMSNFKLKKGVVLRSANFEESVTNDNITDDLAIKWLKDNPNRRSFFETVPSNLEDLLSDKITDGKMFVAPVNPETNLPYSKSSKAYKDALAIYKEERKDSE